LITNKNNPKDIKVTGRVNTTKIGLTIKFKHPMTRVAIMADSKPLIIIPASMYDRLMSAKALKNHLKSVFMLRELKDSF